ncbi:MAG: hypothetical protein JWO95_3197 [Verrucomicrobiales bacterium]|nr:hypothetical protein [Verrucomicrobiales bacterium]
MDNLTHTLIGIGIARAGLSQKLGRGTTVILAVASNLPDIDVACLMSGGPLAFLWRRTPTHSLLGAAILIVLATVVFRRYYPNLSASIIFGLTTLGVAGHVFADLWNAYGVVLFWPFDWRRVSLNWVYIIDLVIWGLLVASWAFSRARPQRTMRIWQTGLSLVAVYIGICAWCNNASANLARAETHSTAPIYVYPEPFGPQRFRAVVQQTNVYAHFLAYPFQHKIESLGKIVPEVKSPVVEAARRTEPARRLDWFLSTPVWRESTDGQAATVYGLEFRSVVLRRGLPFTFRVTPDGQVSREQLVAPDAN